LTGCVTDKRLSQRRFIRYEALGRPSTMFAYQAVELFRAIVVADVHRAAQPDLVGLRCDHRRISNKILQLLNPSFNVALLLFSVVIGAVLGKVAVGGSPADLFRYLRAPY